MPAVLRYADLVLLAVALPVFVVAGWPLLGYAVGAGAWLAARAIGLVADRRVSRDIAGGERRHAVGVMAMAMLGRVWLLALAVLLVGLAEREAGLAAALLAAALFTVYFGGQGLARLFEPETPRS
jgi:putative exporter of polyketide antibiotics